MGYFAAAAMQTSEKNGASISEAQEEVLSTLTNLNLDELSPRDAFALIELLQHQLEGE